MKMEGMKKEASASFLFVQNKSSWLGAREEGLRVRDTAGGVPIGGVLDASPNVEGHAMRSSLAIWSGVMPALLGS